MNSILRYLTLAVLAAAMFVLAPSASAGTYSYTYTGPINVPDFATLTPPPELLSYAAGKITDVDVDLEDINHGWAVDLDVMLESPDHQFVTLFSDSCGTQQISNYDFYFDDDYTNVMDSSNGSCDSTNQHPSNFGATPDTYTTAPDAQPTTSLASLNGGRGYGAWRLHVADDGIAETGSIAEWTITIETDETGLFPIPTTGSGGDENVPATSLTRDVSLLRKVTDVNATINGLVHSYSGDLDIALQSPAGTVAGLFSDACGGSPLALNQLVFDDQAPAPAPEQEVDVCHGSSLVIKPTDFGSEAETTIPGGPAGPYPPSLAGFNGQYPKGQWKLFIKDDAGGDTGSVEGFDLAITVEGAKVVKPGDPKLKFKKSGKRIAASARVGLAGEAIPTEQCSGSVKSTFQYKKVTKRKGKKRKITYPKVVATNSLLTVKNGACGFDVNAKIAKKWSGKKLRLVTSYLGGDYIAPFGRTTSEKIKKIKF